MGFRYYFRIIIKNLFLVDWSTENFTITKINEFIKFENPILYDLKEFIKKLNQ